jgi:hypothetical protein
VRGSSELTASGRHLHTSSLCTSSPCMVILLPPVAEPALASALPRRRSLRDRPCQGTTVRDLVALRAGLSRAATLHLRPRTPEPRASLARIALLLMRLKPPCTSLLAPGRSPPLESCSCTHTLTPPASAPCLLQPCRVIPAHPRSSAHSAPPRTCCSTRAPASPAFAPALATPEPTRCFHCAALQLLFAQRPRASAVCSPEAVGFALALGSRAPPAPVHICCLPHASVPLAACAVASPAQFAPSRSTLPTACSLAWPHAAWPELRATVRLGHQPARFVLTRSSNSRTPPPTLHSRARARAYVLGSPPLGAAAPAPSHRASAPPAPPALRLRASHPPGPSSPGPPPHRPWARCSPASRVLPRAASTPVWQNQPELYRLKYASPLPRAPTCLKWYKPLACRVTSR